MSKDSIHVRAGDRLKQALLAAAEKEKRSLSNLVIKILEEWLEKQKP
jgi:predicted HicB family RNase H-like nuclease